MGNDIKFGAASIDDVKFGAAQVDKVYHGSVEVWTKAYEINIQVLGPGHRGGYATTVGYGGGGGGGGSGPYISGLMDITRGQNAAIVIGAVGSYSRLTLEGYTFTAGGAGVGGNGTGGSSWGAAGPGGVAGVYSGSAKTGITRQNGIAGAPGQVGTNDYSSVYGGAGANARAGLGSGGAGGIGVAQGPDDGDDATGYGAGGGGAGQQDRTAHLGFGVPGNGDKGIVIIKYLGDQRGSGGSYSFSGGYSIHTFTSNGTYIP